MALFSKESGYDRSRLLEAISAAEARGKFKKALALYRKILEVEPKNPDLHRRVAPLLARARQLEEAWSSFKIAADALAKEGRYEKAIGLYREAAHHLPRRVELWLAIAELHVERDRPSDATKALLEGRSHFRYRRHRSAAVRLLSRLRALDPGHVEAGLDLARLLRKSGNRLGAMRVLRELPPYCHRRQLRRVRGAELRLSPSPGALWRWVQALFSGA